MPKTNFWPDKPDKPDDRGGLARIAAALEKIEKKFTGGTGGGDVSELREILLRIEKKLDQGGSQQAVVDQITAAIKANNDEVLKAIKPGT